MSSIKYISLSDLHFGEEDSLLTNLATGSDQVDPGTGQSGHGSFNSLPQDPS